MRKRRSTPRRTSQIDGAPAGGATGILRLSRKNQIKFWRALQSPLPTTHAQRRLGELVKSVL